MPTPSEWVCPMHGGIMAKDCACILVSDGLARDEPWSKVRKVAEQVALDAAREQGRREAAFTPSDLRAERLTCRECKGSGTVDGCERPAPTHCNGLGTVPERWVGDVLCGPDACPGCARCAETDR